MIIMLQKRINKKNGKKSAKRELRTRNHPTNSKKNLQRHFGLRYLKINFATLTFCPSSRLGVKNSVSQPGPVHDEKTGETRKARRKGGKTCRTRHHETEGEGPERREGCRQGNKCS